MAATGTVVLTAQVKPKVLKPTRTSKKPKKRNR